MEFRILGPLEARDGATALRLGGPRQRALLARLLLDLNRTVPLERLIDDLWGESPPETAAKMVQIYVSQLRKVLPEGVLRTRPPGYALELDPECLDLVRFERLAASGRAAFAAGNRQAASAELGEALALWRGPALVEFGEPFAQVEAARLEELRLSCLEDRIEADLELGRPQDLVGELEVLVARHPLREGLRAQHIRALYRAGRQADALAAYRSFRSSLDDELGIEPSERLRELERRILRQDPALAASAAPVSAPAPPRSPAVEPERGGGEVRYVRSGDVSIAYQVVGEGELDLVLVHGWVCSFHPGWEWPPLAHFYRRLAAMGRLILFDKRGTGLSDRVRGIASLEERMDDVRAVLDAVGSERAALVGVSEGGPMIALFAATYPERTAALVAMGTYARRMWAPDYPIGRREADLGWLLPSPDQWGEPIARRFLDERAPSRAGDEAAIRWYTSYIVRGASPGAAVELNLMNREIDVRPVLPTIRVPTLVLCREQEYLRSATRYMAEHIPGAHMVELPGADHVPWEGDADAVLDEIERFLGSLHEEVEPDRVLATVLFTDIVGATAKAAELGDRGWRTLLERHNAIVRAELARHRGKEIDTAGDGFFASFDGPARAIRCAAAIAEGVRPLGIEIRAGLHTGECELADGKLAGIAVHIGARVVAEAAPGEVVVSSTVRDLVAGSGIPFRDRGPARPLAGVPGTWRLYTVEREERPLP